MNTQRPMRDKWIAWCLTIFTLLACFNGIFLVGRVKYSAGSQVDLLVSSVIAAFFLFAESFALLTFLAAYIAASRRNLPSPEELADGDYKIVDDFRSWGRHYYKVRAPDNADVLLVESRYILPPQETRLLTPGSFRHPHRDTDRFEVKNGQLYPTYSGRIT
jgi:hypothetical protein